LAGIVKITPPEYVPMKLGGFIPIKHWGHLGRGLFVFLALFAPFKRERKPKKIGKKHE